MSKEVVVTVCKQRMQDDVENRDLRIDQTKVKWGCTKCVHTTDKGRPLACTKIGLGKLRSS